MGRTGKIVTILSKTAACIGLIAFLAIAATSYSPVYCFQEPSPFKGPDIYNPYSGLDTAHCWKRANFHTHTKVEGPLNECEYWPAQVLEAYRNFGYDIVTFSNHNALTVHPSDTSLQVNVYEHGYNLLKYHKLVFGCDKVRHYDHLLPIFAFQRQHQIDYLGKDSDIIQINHPLRTHGSSRGIMQKLSGYHIMELDSGKSTENEYWDWALSAGHYSFGLAGDDLHYPDRSRCIAVRSSFLCCPSESYEDIKKTLQNGCFYSMRIPDYGHGDWKLKYEGNRSIPEIEHIGLTDSTIRMTLSQKADSIKVTGQDHVTLGKAVLTDSLDYTMSHDTPYARLTAYFPGGEVIYTNPFARYDSALSDTPYAAHTNRVNVALSILYNLFIALLCIGTICLIVKLIRR